MSAGAFQSSKYQLDSGNGAGIAACRIQPETLAATINSAANEAPAGAVTLPSSAKVSGGKREFGINMRTVTLEFTAALPEGYSGDPVRIPVLTESTYAAWSKGQTGTYLAVPVRVIGRSPETVN
jgi:hypothetical protein